MIYNPFYQPDQGYYTQQPATVAQVNNIWSFVKTLRDELAHAVSEFNSHEFELEKNFNKTQEYTDIAKNELSKLITKLNNDFESLDTLLGETVANLEAKITKLEDDKLSSVTLAGEDETIKMAVANGKTTEYKNLRFTTPEDETAITTEITETRDGTLEILQFAPQLEDAVVNAKFDVVEDPENDTVANITYGDEKIAGVEVVSTLLDICVGDGNITIDSGGAEYVIGTIQSNVNKINNTAQSVENSFTYPREVNDEINVTISRETLDGSKRSEQNIALVSDGGEFSTQDGKIRYEPSDEFAQKYRKIETTASKLSPTELKITTETVAYDYNPEAKAVEVSEPYNHDEIIFDNAGTDELLSNFKYDNSRGVVAIDTSRLESKYDERNTAMQNLLKDLSEKVKVLENEVALMKARENNAILQVTPVIRATANDKIELALQRVYADGSHDESKTAIFNFRNNDHSMSIITRDNRTVTGQCDVQINLDKIWLNRQGLDRDMDTF